jgi:hypothetical protein
MNGLRPEFILSLRYRHVTVAQLLRITANNVTNTQCDGCPDLGSATNLESSWSPTDRPDGLM